MNRLSSPSQHLAPGERRGLDDARDRLAIPALGAVTIATYGAAYYGYGVLIGPIATGTGWSATMLGAVFSGVLVATALLGVVGGRLLDRHGPRPLLVVAGTVGAGLIAAAPLAPGYAAFAVLYGAGCGIVGGFGFYHVTQPVAARTRLGDPAGAIVALTIIGVFCSPIYLPATAWLVDRVGWQAAIEVHAALVAAACIPAALILPARTLTPGAARPLEPSRQVLGRALRDPLIRRWTVALLLSGAAADVLLVYQVPAMTAAGLPLAIAAVIGGGRGFAQLAGRLPLRLVLRRIGALDAVIGAYLLAALGSLLLVGGGHAPLALGYVVLAGASLGSLSALQGIYTHRIVDHRHLGVVFGSLQALAGLAGAVGPIAAGVVLDATGSYVAVLLGVAGAFVLAASVLVGSPQTGQHDSPGSTRVSGTGP